MYEGAPNWPAEDRFWDIIERYRVNILYTAPTAIRAFIKWGDQHVEKHDLSSLRLLGTVGEGINPEAWMWYHRKIGGERCPIVDTWWQTETGGIMMSPLPGAIATKPGSCTKPLPGIVPAILDETGHPVEQNNGGMLCISQPWPGMLRGIWGDDERYQQQYWSKVPGHYLTGDNARQDDDGYYWIMGRIDDVINVSGHRLSTIEVESALVSHPLVAEAAAVGRPRRDQGASHRRLRHAPRRRRRRRAESKSSRPTSARKSARWPSPTTSASPPPCPKPAAAKSCGACSATSPPARKPSATPARWKITACWRSCGRKRNDRSFPELTELE